MLARAGAVGVVLVALLGLVACGGSEDGAQTLPSVANVPSETPLPPPSPTEQRTPRPSKKPTSQPSAPPSVSIKPGVDISEEEAASAVAFVERFWAQANDALTGLESPARLRAYYVSTCQTCISIQSDVETVRQNGQRARGGTQQVLETQIDARKGSVVLVRATVQSRPGELLDAEGNVIKEVPRSPVADYVFNLVEQDDSWIIQDLLALGPS